jgi:hypothetical protein
LLELLVADHPILASDEGRFRILTDEEFTPESLAAAVVHAQLQVMGKEKRERTCIARLLG